jgi:hypothetical protein
MAASISTASVRHRDREAARGLADAGRVARARPHRRRDADADEKADEYLLMGLRLAEGIDPARYQELSGGRSMPTRSRSCIRRARSK